MSKNTNSQAKRSTTSRSEAARAKPIEEQIASGKLDGRSTRTDHSRVEVNVRQRLNFLTQEEAARPGSRLLQALMQEAAARGIGQVDMAEVCGISYGYYNQLRTGNRGIPQIQHETFFQNCAAFLRLPYLQVLFMADILKAEHLYESSSYEAQVEAAISFIKKNHKTARFIWSTFDEDMPFKGKELLVHLFEAATGFSLLQGIASQADLLGLPKQ